LVRLIDYGANPQAVLDAPRWKVGAGVSLDMESNASPDLREDWPRLVTSSRRCPDAYMDFGAGHSSFAPRRGLLRGSDPRRDGQAAGY
jgi:gamma-glutamyltranspeptidase/glutathione hydrolase